MVKFSYVEDDDKIEVKKESIETIKISPISNEDDLNDTTTDNEIEIPKAEKKVTNQATKKSKIKSVEIELNENDIKIDNDDIRTSFRLMVKKTNRDNTKETVKAIKDFLDTHEVVEYSKSRYIFRQI